MSRCRPISPLTACAPASGRRGITPTTRALALTRKGIAPTGRAVGARASDSTRLTARRSLRQGRERGWTRAPLGRSALRVRLVPGATIRMDDEHLGGARRQADRNRS